ncbi:maestro heat-like repeat family member 5 isoform X2 [Mauremys reevesii]|uniref:maestro heat-like repeat family member 5 isoform X2 n=1 Tax=Mauremys reevesii TaxID=260615 RepID=UPI00193F2D56|nr:maestro heat-like repeat family member 5 isoform X2 [Mauremys reevesii]
MRKARICVWGSHRCFPSWGRCSPSFPKSDPWLSLALQDLHRVLPDLLDAMLGNLLADSSDTTKLHYILEHINYWIVSRVSHERARAIRSSTALLRSIIALPEFNNSAEFPRMGHHVAQLALFIGDPAKDISQQAREGVHRLYQLLLHQRGVRKVLLGGAEKILPADGSAGHHRIIGLEGTSGGI